MKKAARIIVAIAIVAGSSLPSILPANATVCYGNKGCSGGCRITRDLERPIECYS